MKLLHLSLLSNRLWLAIVVLCLAVVVSAGCDRKGQPYAGRESAAAGNPQYSSVSDPSVVSVSGSGSVDSVMPKKAGAVDGQALYMKSCVACHQVTGQGVPGAFPPLDNSPYVTGPNVERLAAIVLYGLQGPINVNGVTYASAMAPLGSQFSDQELAAIVTYVRGAWSNKAGPVDAKVFSDTRAKWGARGMFSIAELGEEK